MNVFRFLEWKMYKDAKALNKLVEQFSNGFSLDIKRKYYSQFNRASLSVSLNIAEAAGRFTDTEMCRFLDFSQGSLAETIACADNLHDSNHLSGDQLKGLMDIAAEISKQIHGMQKKLYREDRIQKRESAP